MRAWKSLRSLPQSLSLPWSRPAALERTLVHQAEANLEFGHLDGKVLHSTILTSTSVW
jgi:hypothetical protein